MAGKYDQLDAVVEKGKRLKKKPSQKQYTKWVRSNPVRVNNRKIRFTSLGEYMPINPTKTKIYSDEEIVYAFRKNFGIAAATCRELGIAEQTFITWKNKYPHFNKLLDEANESVKDLVEVELIKKIREGDTHVLLFFAKTKLKDRGYTEQVVQANTQVNIIMPEDNNKKYEWWGNKKQDNENEPTSETVGGILDTEQI